MDIPKDSIILAKTHPPMYLIHKYWARKPHNVVKAYIEKYTQPGDVVLDPFCGSGVTVIESFFTGRQAIGVDLNPFSLFLSSTTVSPVNIELFQKIFNKILEDLSNETEFFYGITCPYCGIPTTITQLIWRNTEQDSQKPPKEQIMEIRINCTRCNFKNHIINKEEYPEVYQKENTRSDDIQSKFEKLRDKFQVIVPKISLKYTSGVKFKQIRHYLIKDPDGQNLFTKRNLLVLAILKKKIDKHAPINSSDRELQAIRNLLLLTFTSNLGQSSKMVWVISRRKNNEQKKKEVGSWTHHFFWNPHEFFEINPIVGFFIRGKKTLRAQTNLQQRLKKNNIDSMYLTHSWNDFSNYGDNHKILLMQISSESMPLPDNSVDYIFTDPPYGDSIQYFELTKIWNDWLDFSTEINEHAEIIINSHQKKSKEDYFQNLTTVFKECYRILKKDRYMTITFHNTDIYIRNGLIKAAYNAGFKLDSLLFQMPPRNSLKSYLHYEKTPAGDYFLRFKKVYMSELSSHKMKFNELQKYIRLTIIDILQTRGEPTPLTIIYNCIDEKLAKIGQFPLEDTSIVEKIIRSMQDSCEINIDRNQYMWFINSVNKITKTSLTQRISTYLEKIENINKKPYFQVYNSVYKHFNGYETPDRRHLTELIEKTKKGIKNFDETCD